MNTIRKFAALALSVIAVTAVNAQETACDAQARMVREAIPVSVGSPSAMEKLLNPTVDAQLSATFDPARAAGVVRDSLALDTRCTAYRKSDVEYDCRYNGAASVLKIEMERGRIAYLSRTRSERKAAPRSPRPMPSRWPARPRRRWACRCASSARAPTCARSA